MLHQPFGGRLGRAGRSCLITICDTGKELSDGIDEVLPSLVLLDEG